MKTINFLVISALLLNSCGRVTHEKFDANKWQNSNLNAEENWNLRWQMMNDLRKTHRLVGMTEPEIQKLLGKPETRTEKEFYYNLGMTGTGINTGSLTIIFNEKNIVEQIMVTQG